MELTFLSGSLKGRSLNFDDALITIGRSYTNILMLNDNDVSSHHAFIEKIHERWMLFDNSSRNGIMLNNNRIAQKKELFDGDIVRIGAIKFSIQLTETNRPVGKSLVHRIGSTLGFKKAPKKLLADNSSERSKELRHERLERLNKNRATAIFKMRAVAFILLIFCGISGYFLYPQIMELYQEQQQIPQALYQMKELLHETVPPEHRAEIIPIEPALQAQLKKSPLFIHSYPKGAEVELDGQPIGITPLELSDIDCGVHTLTLYKEGYQLQERTINLPEGPTQSFNLLLEDYTALITSTPPGAAVLIGGQLHGHTPLLLRRLKPAILKYTLQAPGFLKANGVFQLNENNKTTAQNTPLELNLGSVKITTQPANCTVSFNRQQVGDTKSDLQNAISSEITIDRLIPGNYELTVSTADGNESQSTQITVEGGKTIEKEFRLWAITTVLNLDDESKVYGMILEQHENGDILFSEDKGNSKLYAAVNIATRGPASLQDKFGFKKGIALRKDRFKPILATIHNENDERDFAELQKQAEDAGSFQASQLVSDISAMDLIEFQEKYKGKKIQLSGSVSMVREGESKYSIVLSKYIECYLEKSGEDDQKKQMINILNKNINISGYCLGLRGLDKIVIENSEIQP